MEPFPYTWTWEVGDGVSVFTLTRRIHVARDMSALEFYRAIQDVLDTKIGITWDQILTRITDELFEWYDEPYEILGPGIVRYGSIIDRKNNDVLLLPGVDLGDIGPWNS